MQRKVQSRNKSIDEYMKVYGGMINIIFTTHGASADKIEINVTSFVFYVT